MTRKLLARMKVRQTRGASWLQIIINVGIITANVKLFYPEASAYVYAFCAVVWIFATTAIGFVDEFRGIWKHEQEYIMETITPTFARIDKNVNAIIEEMKKK